MRELIQTGLRISAVFFILWSLALVADPLAVHKLISTGPFDPVTQTMLSGSFLGFAILLLIGSSAPREDFTGGMAVMMIIIGGVSVFSMMGSQGMPTNMYTVPSVIFILGMGAYLVSGQMMEMMASAGSGSSRRKSRPSAKKKPAKKAKKKVAKKKAKKKAVKKRRR